MRRFFCAAVVTLSVCAVAMGDEFLAYVRKIEGGEVSFNKRLKKGAQFDRPEKLPLAPNPRMATAKFNKDTKKIEAAEPLSAVEVERILLSAPAQGAPAVIVTDPNNRAVTQILFIALKSKKK
jgi:hypothetical protein